MSGRFLTPPLNQQSTNPPVLSDAFPKEELTVGWLVNVVALKTRRKRAMQEPIFPDSFSKKPGCVSRLRSLVGL